MTRSCTYRAVALFVAAFALAGIFTTQTGFAAEPVAKAGRVEAVSVKPVANATLSREVGASVKQLSQDLTKQLMSPRPGQEPLVHALPNAQRMQQSLEAYFRAIAAKLLGDGGDGIGGGEGGICMPGVPAMCDPGDDFQGSVGGQCEGNPEGGLFSFGHCGKGETVTCQHKGSGGTYYRTSDCRWVKMP